MRGVCLHSIPILTFPTARIHTQTHTCTPPHTHTHTHAHSESLGQQLSTSWQRKGALQDQGSRLKEFGLQLISSTATAVEQKVGIAMRDIEGQLLPIVDQFQAVPFDPAHCQTYREGLCEWVDAQLVRELAKVGGASLGAMHDQAQTQLIGECARLCMSHGVCDLVHLPPDTYQSLLQLPENELSRFNQLVRPPQLSYVLKCADLTEDFSEDLEFHFSLGLGRLAVRGVFGCLDFLSTSNTLVLSRTSISVSVFSFEHG